MANTYTQLYVHFIFAVQNRIGLIRNKWQDDLYKYMTGIVLQQGHKLLSIGGMPDHIHLLAGMNPKQAPSDLMFHLKRSSSVWINENRLIAGRFSWQDGFGAFSYGKSQISNVITYIENQENHHRKQGLKEEYIAFLKAFEIEYDERYVLRSVDEEEGSSPTG